MMTEGFVKEGFELGFELEAAHFSGGNFTGVINN